MNHKEKLEKQQINDVAGGAIFITNLGNDIIRITGTGGKDGEIVKRKLGEYAEAKGTIIEDVEKIFQNEYGQICRNTTFSCLTDSKVAERFENYCLDNKIDCEIINE